MAAASIIVPVFNAFDSVARCLTSIYQARTEVPFEVIVLDNGSMHPLDEHLGNTRNAFHDFRSVRSEKALGFPRAVNEGVRYARHDYLVLLNSDTVVTDRWLDGLVDSLIADPAIAAAGPVTNRCGRDSQVRQDTYVTSEPQSLSFFCVAIRRTVWEQLGGLDEVYGQGNFEDDDFCLRARLAGYRLAVAPSVFVDHEANRTFEANKIDLAELMARNQGIFLERASRWSRSLMARVEKPGSGDSISVIVTVLESDLPVLRGSMVSLCNQTISGFEVVLVHPAGVDVSPAMTAIPERLRTLTEVLATADANRAALLNAGLHAARGTRIAYLPAGDVFYPFHLEVLLSQLDNRSIDAAYCAWSVYSNLGGRERRGAITFDQAEPVRLRYGYWAPIVCWMHWRDAAASNGFDESFHHFAEWAFTRDLISRGRVKYIRRITAEVPVSPALANREAYAEAERILGKKADGTSQPQNEFLDGVRKGCWEHEAVIVRNEVQRRARRLIGDSPLARFNAAQLDAARARLDASPQAIVPDGASAIRNVFLFSLVRWTALTLPPQHFARGLAARGYRVFWIDVQLQQPHLFRPDRITKEIVPGLHYVELPGEAGEIYHFKWSNAALDLMTRVVQRINEAHPAEVTIQLVTFPKWTPLALRLSEGSGWPIVYDCLDDHDAFGELFQHDAAKFEDELIRRSSAVITAARILFERYITRHPNVALIPNAAEYETFHNGKPNGLLVHLRRPVVGFFGAFAEWLDLEWIEDAARSFPDWSFVYIGLESFASASGREQWRRATAAANVTVVPQVDILTLADYLAEFDICTMPFRDRPITRAMNPVKIYEYLAASKTVIVPDLPETRPFAEQGLILTYKSPEESFHLLRQAVRTPVSEAQAAARSAFAAANTWSQRLDALINVFDSVAR